ncbi:DNA polymerase III subunit delta [Gephyromycinifex aptenodytis]|uniref:DNA polymerase III subunit delta n=1 Tax=Gephyromycinifex aptenodytis TaxID=2716227 RepID=UPI001447B1E4|nr:DNA polymerase III subunit delta [Gephyromycinifex aptenodytis]
MTSAPPASGVPPLVLISGPEAVIAERALESTLDALRCTQSDLEVVRLYGAAYEPGQVGMQSAPSLFGGAKALVVSDVDEAGEDLQSDLLGFLKSPVEDVTLVALHKGGNRGKKVLEAMKKSGARVIEAPAIKSDKDKTDFATHEFRRAGRKATAGAVRSLIEAVGRDVRELASACKQLIDDTTGVIDEDTVHRYHGGRVDATGFRVADAAVAGNSAEALRLLRHALASGVDPVPIVAVLAVQLRQLIKVAGAGRGPTGQLAKGLGMAPWQIERARRSLQGWDVEALGAAIQAVAAADFAVKGGGRDPVYAVEHAVWTICELRRQR